MENFKVIYRNYGHWDICNNEHGRIFVIRGGPGNYRVRNEITNTSTKFKTVSACMSFICDKLMFELIVAEGQKPQIIESWNV